MISKRDQLNPIDNYVHVQNKIIKEEIERKIIKYKK